MNKIKYFFFRLSQYLMVPIAWVWYLFHRKAFEDMEIIVDDAHSDSGN